MKDEINSSVEIIEKLQKSETAIRSERIKRATDHFLRASMFQRIVIILPMIIVIAPVKALLSVLNDIFCVMTRIASLFIGENLHFDPKLSNVVVSREKDDESK